MPRKPTLDNAKKEIACALARAGMTGRWIAAFFGVDESTLRYALAHDESFRMRYDQARAYLFLDHLMHIARASSKSWRASAWLLERAFPECNLRHRMPEPEEDPFNREPPAGADEEAGCHAHVRVGMPDDVVSRSPDRDIPHQPEAQAREDLPQPVPSPRTDSGDSPTPNPQPPAPSPQPDMDMTAFETSEMLKTVAWLRYGSSPHIGLAPDSGLPPADPFLAFGQMPEPLPPRNHNPIRERIYAEDAQGFEVDKILYEETRKEEEAQRAAMRECS